MVKVSKESLETFQSVLETVDTSWQTEFNLRETVRQSFELIKKAKQHKVSWEKIAEILKQSSGMTDGISPESIRQYYFEFSKNPDLLPKKKRKI
jgi:translation initiation factor 2B subunit (eIF-2B alpha/beta/delta family)